VQKQLDLALPHPARKILRILHSLLPLKYPLPSLPPGSKSAAWLAKINPPLRALFPGMPKSACGAAPNGKAPMSSKRDDLQFLPRTALALRDIVGHGFRQPFCEPGNSEISRSLVRKMSKRQGIVLFSVHNLFEAAPNASQNRRDCMVLKPCCCKRDNAAPLLASRFGQTCVCPSPIDAIIR